jgi:predicted nucleotidyltransferase
MTISGIIVEYNPMHNGHLFHIEQTKKITSSDAIIAVMSGNFVQRGEPAFINKWSRTKMALLGGVDLVIELPLIYSISSAEGFAFGAVSTLNSLGIVDNICFGSESGDINELSLIANILTQEPTAYKSFLHDQLKSGISYPKARENSLTNYIITNNIKNVKPDIVQNTISSSNNILAIEYIKALIKISSNIKPIKINRISNSYNDKELTGELSSATSIRNNFSEGSIKSTLPSFSYDIINKEIKEGRGPISLNDFSNIILYKLRNSDENYIEALLDVEEGLHNKIKIQAENCNSITQLIENVKNKRYTRTRIQRILLYAMLGITKTFKEKIHESPEYIRVLGFNSKGRALLHDIKKKCPLPVISNPTSKHAELMKYDILASDIYVLGYKGTNTKYSKQDLKTPPIIL